jgi:hypothetical protein
VSTIDISIFDASQTPPWPVRRFTVKEYRQLGECGVLSPEDRVELLDGWIVPKMNQRPAHRYAVGILNEWLQRNLPEGFIGLCQLPITTANSEPEPDLTGVRGSHSDYRERHPYGNECRLVVEVADSSVERDRLKAAIYSSASVKEYWILNLVDRQLERFMEPAISGYQSSTVVHQNQPIELNLGETVLRPELSEFLRSATDLKST